MKTPILIAALAAGIALAGYSQSTNINNLLPKDLPPPAPTPTSSQNAAETALDYFISFNTNLADCFADNRVTLWAGASSVQGGAAALVNNIGASYDVYRPTPATNSPTLTAVCLDGQILNSGVTGTMVSGAGGVGFALIHFDVRAEVYADAVYNLGIGTMKAEADAEIGLRIFKAIGHNFFTGIGIADQVPRNSQLFSGYAGATF
jgi:hypothetical protein